jgi:hypothetical protein
MFYVVSFNVPISSRQPYVHHTQWDMRTQRQGTNPIRKYRIEHMNLAEWTISVTVLVFVSLKTLFTSSRPHVLHVQVISEPLDVDLIVSVLQPIHIHTTRYGTCTV